jgi:uracil-DNA glycosylase family 4
MSKEQDKTSALEEINNRWIRECACTLRETATQAVPGDGSAYAEIVFIGEGPGRDEDIQGKPFVGAAGKFLSEMLGTIKLKREDVYITNVVKYRPPNNRDPLPEEVASCYPWLVEQINLINPKLIILLGRHALERFFPEEKISRVHGKILRRTVKGIGARNFYALYHPAAALYNGGMRETLIEDFKKIPKVLDTVRKLPPALPSKEPLERNIFHEKNGEIRTKT